MATERMGVRNFIDSRRPLEGIVKLFQEMESLGYKPVTVMNLPLLSKVDIIAWCNDRFKHHHWIAFGGTYWFTDESRAIEFKLRWL